MANDVTAVDVARRLADALEQHSIPYAIGGALALAYYAPPRATVDVDINVFVQVPQDLDRTLNVLSEVGFSADDSASVQRTATTDGQFRGRVGGMRVDVFVPAIEFYAAMATRTKQVSLLGRPIVIVGPEDLLTLKMMFFRRKDLADVEAVLRGSAATLKLDTIRATLVEYVGEDDERVTEWDKIVADVSAP